MGEAKRRAALHGQTLREEMRAKMLGTDPFKVAYELIYGMVETVFTQAGGLNHELIGMEFEGGKPIGVNTLPVTRVEDVPRLRARMLERWPMVAHVFEAWAAPDASMPAHAHPDRYDICAIMLHTSEFVAIANCRVDVAQKTIERAELCIPEALAGNLGRAMAPRTLSS